jgi:hypothetical protein
MRGNSEERQWSRDRERGEGEEEGEGEAEGLGLGKSDPRGPAPHICGQGLGEENNVWPQESAALRASERFQGRYIHALHVNPSVLSAGSCAYEMFVGRVFGAAMEGGRVVQ